MNSAANDQLIKTQEESAKRQGESGIRFLFQDQTESFPDETS